MAGRIDGEPLHHDRPVDPKDIDAVAQPAGGVRCIHQNLVAVAERGKHGIAGHPDHRQIARIAERHAPEPVTAKGEAVRSEEHTSELQSLMRISYSVFCLNKKNKNTTHTTI